jgi:3-hydroxybutyryl-CoA dehydratase
MKGTKIMDDVRGLNDGLTGYFIEDIFVGQTAVYAKTVTEADVVLFAGISGDTNPVHLNDEFASTTMFKGRIAHGILTASFISTVLGTRLPGPGCIYMSQNLKFKAPVRIGDTVNARVTVLEVIAEKRRVVFKTVVSVGETVVIDGDATLMVPSRG